VLLSFALVLDEVVTRCHSLWVAHFDHGAARDWQLPCRFGLASKSWKLIVPSLFALLRRFEVGVEAGGLSLRDDVEAGDRLLASYIATVWLQVFKAVDFAILSRFVFGKGAERAQSLGLAARVVGR